MEFITNFISEYGLMILYALLTALAGFIGTQIKKIYENHVNDETKQKVVATCVKAVEQLYQDLNGEEKLNKANPLPAAFYFSAKAYTDQSGCVVLKFGSDFDIQMAKSYNAVPTLCSILSSLLGTSIPENRVLFECDGKATESSVIDEILESAQED